METILNLKVTFLLQHLTFGLKLMCANGHWARNVRKSVNMVISQTVAKTITQTTHQPFKNYFLYIKDQGLQIVFFSTWPERNDK